MNRSFNCEAWKCRAVGIKRVCSREPCERVSGLRDAEDLGVDTPVCGPVPVPYIVEGCSGNGGERKWIVINMFWNMCWIENSGDLS